MDHIDYQHPDLRHSLVDDVTYVTSLRHPLGRLKSHLNYDFTRQEMYKKCTECQKKEKPDLLQIYFTGSNSSQFKIISKFKDKGTEYVHVPKELKKDKEKIDKFVKEELGRIFKVVLITEYFDESLILMRRRLCWDLQDILYFQMKLGKYSYKTKTYPPEYLQKHKALKVSITYM